MFEPIYRGNDYYVKYTVTAPDADSGAEVPVPNLVLNIRISLTQDDPLIPGSGDAVHADLNKPAPALSGSPGDYACVFDGDKITAHLDESIHHVYVIVESGVGDILANDRVSVRRIRRAA